MRAEQTIYPIGWELRELSDVATVIDCKHVTAQFVPDGFPVISIGELGGRFVDLENGPRTTHDYYALLAEGARRPQKGDVIMTRNATIGRCSLVPETDVPFAMGQDVCLVRPKKGKFCSDFLKLILGSPSFAHQFESMMAGSTFKRLNVQQVKKLMVLTPSLNEQGRIAQMIVSVEEHAGELERLLAKKRDVKQGMMQELLAGRTRLPGFAGDWSGVRLGDVLTVRHGRDQKAVEVQGGRYKILATGGQIGTTDTPLYSKPSVLIGRKGTIDRPLFQDEPFWSVDTLFYTDIGERADPKYLFYVFQTIDWRSMNEASGVPSLNSARIEAVEVNLPAPNEQCAIRTILDDVDAEIEALEHCLESAREVKVGMMQELLTGRTRLPVEEEA